MDYWIYDLERRFIRLSNVLQIWELLINPSGENKELACRQMWPDMARKYVDIWQHISVNVDIKCDLINL